MQYSTPNYENEQKERQAAIFREMKKFWNLYTDVSVERSYSQIRNPAETNFPVSYYSSTAVRRCPVVSKGSMIVYLVNQYVPV